VGAGVGEGVGGGAAAISIGVAAELPSPPQEVKSTANVDMLLRDMKRPAILSSC
jgi:hypothetical protein